MAEKLIPEGAPISYKLGSDGRTINNVIVYYEDPDKGKKMPYFDIDPAQKDKETAIRWIQKLLLKEKLWLFGNQFSDKLSRDEKRKANSDEAWSYAIENFINIIELNAINLIEVFKSTIIGNIGMSAFE